MSVYVCTCDQLEEKEAELAESVVQMGELRQQHESLAKQLEASKRYLEGLPTAEQHTANQRLVNVCCV